MPTRPHYRRRLSPPDTSFFLFGPRGVGKSTWVRAHFKDALSFDLLDEAVFQDLLADVGSFGRQLNVLAPGSWVVVDEVQRLPNLLNEVHRYTEARQLRFVLSGSSARKLRRAGTNLLAGRALQCSMLPLLPSELGQDFDLERALSAGTLPLIWQRGGGKDVLRAYVQTYLAQEIQAEALVRNLPGFARFLPVAALFHGQVLNVAGLARDAGVARTTIASYLDILEDTLLAFRLTAFEGRLRVKERRHPKLYWADAGIARAARRRFGALQEDERGALVEGFVAGLLRASQIYDDAFDDWNYWCPTGAASLEVDFLLWRDGACVAIEVKASSRLRAEHGKGLRALQESNLRPALQRCLIVYLGDRRLRTDAGIDVLPLQDFIAALQADTLFPGAMPPKATPD